MIPMNYKAEILCAAKDIATEEGLSKLNIRAVAKKAGIAVGTVYNYYPSKIELLSEVIEDFWESAFYGIKWDSLPGNDFCRNLDMVYRLLHQRMKAYKSNWLKDLSMLGSGDKEIGRIRQKEYFEKIHGRIVHLMDMDSKMTNFPWDDEFGREETIAFIFSNMMMQLRRGDDDLGYLLKLLRRIFS